MLRTILCLAACIAGVSQCLGQEWEKPSATAARRAGAVQIDGKLADPAWAAAQWCTNFTSGSRGQDNRGAPRPVAVQTRFKVVYDDAYLYVGAECDEPQTETIRAASVSHDGTVWSDDCVEIFFDPAGEGRYYHHFLVNTKGVWYDDYSADYGLVHGKLWHCAIETAAVVDAEAGKWSVEVRIPFGGLILHEDVGPDWLWNVARERHAAGRLELSSWSPLKGNFHSPRLFGKLVGVDVDYKRFALELAAPAPKLPPVVLFLTGAGVFLLVVGMATA